MVFCPDKKEVAQRFRRSLATYDENALIQKKVSERLVELLHSTAGRDFSRVLEVGCCTGGLTEMLCSRSPMLILFLNDLVPECCEAAQERARRYLAEVVAIPGDIEEVLLPRSLDLIVSSSTLQWLANYPAVLAKFADALTERGYLVFSLFGRGTLQEIQELTGRGLPYLALEHLCALLGSHFDILSSQTCEDSLLFQGPRDVLRHLQATGVSGLGNFRWSPSGLRAFEEDYRRLFTSGGKVRLSYVSHFLVARKKGQGGGDARG